MWMTSCVKQSYGPPEMKSALVSSSARIWSMKERLRVQKCPDNDSVIVHREKWVTYVSVNFSGHGMQSFDLCQKCIANNSDFVKESHGNLSLAALGHCRRRRTNSLVTLFNGPRYMDVPVLANQQEIIYISSVWTQDVFWKTYRERWTIETNGEKESQWNPCRQCDLMVWGKKDFIAESSLYPKVLLRSSYLLLFR